MKKYLILLLLFCIGCSKNVNLNCTITDNNSIYGNKKISDTLIFKNDKLIKFTRTIKFSFYNDMTYNIKNVYKSMKNEAKTFKKFVGGKYKIGKDSNSITTINNTKKFKDEKLSYIGIDNNSNYTTIKSNYKDMGFSCK